MTPGTFGPSIISARDIADYLRNTLCEQSGNPLQVTSDFLRAATFRRAYSLQVNSFLLFPLGK
jgi:hypothetical protein